MKNNTLYTVLLASISIFLISCSENFTEQKEVDTGYEYFPLKVGNEWIYEVDSTVYNNSSVVVSSQSQLREKVVDTLKVGDRTEYIIHRSSRKDDTADWNTSEVLTTSIENNKVIRTENNLKFIKLVFPVRDGKTWDGNVYFDANRKKVKVYGEPLAIYRDWDYEMELNDSTAQVNGVTYDKVLAVNHIDSETLFTLNRSSESYAKNVGMITKSHTFYKTSNNDKNIPISKRVEYGFDVKYKLLSFK